MVIENVSFKVNNSFDIDDRVYAIEEDCQVTIKAIFVDVTSGFKALRGVSPYWTYFCEKEDGEYLYLAEEDLEIIENEEDN